MSDELIGLDFNVQVSRVRDVSRLDMSADVSEEAIRMTKACKHALVEASRLVKYMTYEEKALLLRMEDYFKRNKHLGKHWLDHLRNMNIRYKPRWREDSVRAMLRD